MNDNEEKLNYQNIRKGHRKIIGIALTLIIFILISASIVMFFINKIPSKYYGTYVNYDYYDGEELKYTIKISPLAIQLTDLDINGDPKEKKVKYFKKGEDLIIDYHDEEQYIILEDDCLYLETSKKDIEFSKKYGSFFWNEKSDKADLYEIDRKAERYGDILEDIVNSWSRELIYKTVDTKVGSSNFYIFTSDEESDKTDLKSYEVILEAANGDLSLYFDRKEKKLKRIRFSGTVSNNLYGADRDSMDIEDIYDSRALLLASMFLLNDLDNLKLSYNLDTLEELKRQSSAVMDYDALFINKTVDKEHENEYRFFGSIYDVTFHSRLYESIYSLSGSVSWSIDLK